ncbi:MFS transporter [Microbacterium saperdae]|uniref:Putative MFS family arabinose efflux permease n=1 Tax=Microbacterium saperdae TaxID=69368 RepID=A0A543BBA4_9MICO|nr:MFS transporter [Microbacterium saperdae]TQL82124.1 putative MFS family arabinose efflux permease [Microbacterium saperdae]GGM37393.1 MFS transporter [Microbacterium saperdae]
MTSIESIRRFTPDRQTRRARLAVSALFLTNGALFANILPRYPEIKSALGLDNVGYGLAIAAFPAGAIAAGLLAAVLIRRFGSARIAVIGTILTSLGLLSAALAPSGLLFAAALLIGGASDAITDVAQNAHGLRVQRRYGRSIINSFHAIWSIGAVLGGGMAAVAIALQLPLGVHLGISTAVFGIVALVALRFCLPGRDDEVEADAVAEPAELGETLRRGMSPRTVFVLIALTIIAMAGAVAEDAGNSWATLYLGESLGAAAAIAPLGFIALVGAQFIGRLIGDGLTDRFGQRAVARVGGLIAAVGMGLALAFPSVPGTILGFAAVGFGIATLIPAAMHAADELPGLRPGVGLTIVSWLLRLGFLLSPPFVGYIAETESLRAGLLVAPVAALVAVALAGVLEKRKPRG